MTSLDWTAPGTGGTTAGMFYDTVRSGDPADFLAVALCLESDDGPGTSAVYPATPLAG